MREAIGFYRARYDDATLGANTQGFRRPAGRRPDRTAGRPVGAGRSRAREPLARYLALLSRMGSSLDSRAWEQISGALRTIEYDERGTSGHDAYAVFARAIIKPVADRLGWDARPDETPDVQQLRRRLLADLGAWGDPEAIREARRRFDAFVRDRSSVRPDEQALILSIVMRDADPAIYQQVHALAQQATDEAERERYYGALTKVRDPQLAAQVAQIAVSSELPPQARQLAIDLVMSLAKQHHELAWSTFSNHADTLLAPMPSFAPLIIAQYVPAVFWDSVPLDQLEAWVRSHVPAEMASNVERGMETARFMLSEKQALVAAADAYVHSISIP